MQSLGNLAASASSDPEVVAAGLRRYLARYPKTAKPLGVRLDANSTLHRPDPVPAVFGYHEVFHLLVIAGSPPISWPSACTPCPSAERSWSGS